MKRRVIEAQSPGNRRAHNQSAVLARDKARSTTGFLVLLRLTEGNDELYRTSRDARMNLPAHPWRRSPPREARGDVELDFQMCLPTQAAGVQPIVLSSKVIGEYGRPWFDDRLAGMAVI